MTTRADGQCPPPRARVATGFPSGPVDWPESPLAAWDVAQSRTEYHTAETGAKVWYSKTSVPSCSVHHPPIRMVRGNLGVSTVLERAVGAVGWNRNALSSNDCPSLRNLPLLSSSRLNHPPVDCAPDKIPPSCRAFRRFSTVPLTKAPNTLKSSWNNNRPTTAIEMSWRAWGRSRCLRLVDV